jgi:hypothetical protein
MNVNEKLENELFQSIGTLKALALNMEATGPILRCTSWKGHALPSAPCHGPVAGL